MYGDIASWRTYAAARGDDAPSSASDELATEALVRASDYIQFQYVSRLLSGYDDTLAIVETATYIAAGLELATVGFFTKTFTPAEQVVVTRVGSISFQPVSESTGRYGDAVPRHNLIEAMFEPYVTPRPGEVKTASFIQQVG